MTKKLLFTALVFGLINQAFSVGRSIDWSVDQIIKPATSLSSNTSTGTKIDFNFILKNNGPDSAKIGDTILYQMAFLSGSTPIYAFPNAGYYFVLLKKNMGNGDTLQIKGAIQFGVYPNSSASLNFGVLSHIVNRANGLTFEGAGTIANNQKTTPFIWYNPQGWPVAVANFSVEKPKIYPTVANEVIHVNLPVTTIGKTTVIRIYSVIGNLISEKIVPEGESTCNISTNGISNGSYIVSVDTGGQVTSTRVIIQK
jgi:hypothetical protein